MQVIAELQHHRQGREQKAPLAALKKRFIRPLEEIYQIIQPLNRGISQGFSHVSTGILATATGGAIKDSIEGSTMIELSGDECIIAMA
jgi:hypothetical protein